MEEVEGYLGLRKSLVPEVDGEVLVHAAKASNEVVLESVDGSFSSIVVVQVWWDKLVVDAFRSHVALQGTGCFIIKAL